MDLDKKSIQMNKLLALKTAYTLNRDREGIKKAKVVSWNVDLSANFNST